MGTGVEICSSEGETAKVTRTLRGVARALAVIAITLATYLVLLASNGLLLPFPKTSQAWKRRVMRQWARAMARVAGVRITAHGRRPQGAFYLVSNHLGYL